MKATRTVDCVDVAFEVAKLASLAGRTPPSSLSWPLALQPCSDRSKALAKANASCEMSFFCPAAVSSFVAPLGRHGGGRCSRRQAGKACERGFQLSNERLGFGIPRKGLGNAARTLLCKFETGSEGLTRRASSSSYSFDSLSISPYNFSALCLASSTASAAFLAASSSSEILACDLAIAALRFCRAGESCLDRNLRSARLAFGERVSFPRLLHFCLHRSKLLRTLEVLVVFEPVQDLCQIALWRGRRLLRWPCSSLAVSTWDLGCSGRRARSAVGLRSPTTPTTACWRTTNVRGHNGCKSSHKTH